MTRPSPTPSPQGGLVAAGGWAFLITSFLGRLPSSMVQLGYLMVLAQDGRGFAVAGLAVAAAGLGSAIGAPLVGHLVDRLGPGPTLTGATITSCLAQAAFIVGLTHGRASWQLLTCAAIVGAANPQIGPVVRSHWSHLAARLRQPQLVTRALGYEGMVDELGFVIGPVLASALVTGLGASSAALSMLALTLALQGLFLFHLWRDRANWPVAGSRAASGGDEAGVGVGALWPMLACLGVGTLFGATQTGLTALFDLRGTPGLTGVVYGCVGIGSGVASLMVGRLPQRVTTSTRVLTGGLLMLAGAMAMTALPHVVIAAGVALVLGCGAGLALVSSFGWMERIAPRHRMATWMTVLATCITLGVSGGAAMAGRLADQPSHSFWPVFVAGLLAIAGALGMWRDGRRIVANHP